MPNKEISLQFACRIIMQSHSLEGVYWIVFAIGRQQHRESLKEKKEVKSEVSTEEVGEEKKVVVLGNKGCFVAESLEVVMMPFVLSVKKEASEEINMEKK
jgi:deoxycytidine triphosphate deaminase